MSIQNYRYEDVVACRTQPGYRHQCAGSADLSNEFILFLTMQNTEPIFRTERIW